MRSVIIDQQPAVIPRAFIVGRFRTRATSWAREHIPGRITPRLLNTDATIRSYLAAALTRHERDLGRILLVDARPAEGGAAGQCAHAAVLRGGNPHGRGQGEIDPAIDPKSLAMVIVSTLRGAVSQYLLDPEGVNLDIVADTLVALLRKGVEPR